MKITIIQTDIFWQDITRNLAQYTKALQNLKTDIVILPEMFTTAFTMKPQPVAETMDGQSIQWMRTQAADLQSVIAGSLIIKENGHYYNRFVWMQADGICHYYNKRHLFRISGEDKAYTAGEEQQIISYKGWRICPQVCYDLRFPVWSRNQASLNYDMLIYVANWPSVRSHAWKTLLQARAIENLAYTIGVNRIGTDNKQQYYSGDSSLIDYKGEVLWTKSDEAASFTYTLDKVPLQQFRKDFPVWRDADDFKLT